jgi:nucleotide-binding universal stress UspA family protein
MTHKRILVALSPTDGRDPAFERALALAEQSGAELYLLHAVPATYPFSYRAKERLERAALLRKRADDIGVRVVTAEQHGDPADIIVLHADSRPVDLIVMGTERRNGWARWRQPSVAERVLRRTKRPTLVVSDNDDVTAGFENVLVAVDLSPASGSLIDTAMHLLGTTVRQVTAIHAVDSVRPVDGLSNGAWWLLADDGRDSLDEVRQRLSAVLRRTSDVGITPALRVAAGPAAEAIRAQADDVKADLIVMGRTKRFMHLGSTAVRILRETQSALLVIPPTAAAPLRTAEQSVYRRAA